MKTRVLLLFLFALTLHACGQKEGSFQEMVESMVEKTVPLIKSNTLNANLKNKEIIILLDAREATEYKVSHIQGAKNVGYDNFDMKELKDIDKNAMVVVYCSVGYRSEKIGEKLQQAGYTHVFNLYGGIFDWKNRGYKVVDNQETETEKVHAYNKSWGKWLIKGVKIYD